jgi:hypothetical protein
MREQQPEFREKQPDSVGASPTTGHAGRGEMVRWLLLTTVPGVLCTMLGPLGTYSVPLTERALFWIPTMALGSIIGGSLSVMSRRSPTLSHNPVLRMGLVAGVMTLIMTGVVMLMSRLVFGQGATALSPELVVYVGVITITMSVVGYLSFERDRRVEQASAAPIPLSAPQHPALSSRLAQHLRDHPVLALQAEDHYVRVHTPAGSDLLLIRLTDAAAEMTPVTGARTHRSWWVNRSAVQGISRKGTSTVLVLTNGLEVPVGRSYASELRDAGWLAG